MLFKCKVIRKGHSKNLDNFLKEPIIKVTKKPTADFAAKEYNNKFDLLSGVI